MSSQHLGEAQIRRRVEQWEQIRSETEQVQRQAEELRQQQVQQSGGRS